MSKPLIDPLIKFEVVTHSLTPDIHIPAEMGTPSPQQMLGTKEERLCEMAGRICYDSLGAKKSRPSAEYHQHILEVGHGSVWEHANVTVEILCQNRDNFMMVLLELINRPGVYVDADGAYALRLTANLRTLVEWERWTPASTSYMTAILAQNIRAVAAEVSPAVIGAADAPRSEIPVNRVAPATPHEVWISAYGRMSRGCSHELVRHGDFTAISQRSTRYVDESDSPWVMHPLISQIVHLGGDIDPYVVRPNDKTGEGKLAALATKFDELHDRLVGNAAQAYRNMVGWLQAYLIDKGIDKFTARKQARGAARGYLGNALTTEMIFSASVAQWRWMFHMRASQHADAEIRCLFFPLLAQFKADADLAGYFDDIDLADSPDGIGQVAVFRDESVI